MPIQSRSFDVPGLPHQSGYAYAVTATGPLVFLSGQVALDESGAVVGEGDLGVQTREALANLRRAIGAVGGTWRDVVRLGWFLLDASQVQIVRDVRDEVLGPELGDVGNPASTLVQVSALFRPELLVEVEAVVALP